MVIVFVCLVDCLGFSYHPRIFHSHGDVTNTGEGFLSFDIRSAHMVIEQ